jgi:hypothetical protein
MRIDVYVDEKKLELVDKSAKSAEISRAAWVNLAITEKLTTRGLRDIPAIDIEGPHAPPR